MRHVFFRVLILPFLFLSFFSTPSFGQGFKQTEEQVSNVLKFTREWMALLDKQEYENAYEYFSDGLKTQLSFDQWKEHEIDIRNRTGEMVSRKIELLKWWPDVNGISGALAVGAQTYGEFENGDHYKMEVSIMFGDENNLQIERIETSFASFEDIEYFRARQTSNSGRRFLRAEITEEDWQTYLNEILALSSWRSYVKDDQLVIDKADPRAVYVFTTPSHFAYPAVVRRGVETENGKSGLTMIGYYAGSKSEFDIWWHQFIDLNAELEDSLK